MTESAGPVNLDAFTPDVINGVTADNYEEMLAKIFPASQTSKLCNGMQVLEGGGPRKFVFIPGFHTCILNETLLIDETMKCLGADDGYLVFDWPGIGQNGHIDPDEDVEGTLFQTLGYILDQFDVQVLVPTSLACRLVFFRLSDLAGRHKELRVVFIVPAILPGPHDDVFYRYFSFFTTLHTRFGIHSYRCVNNFWVARWIWNRVICPGVRDPRAVPLEDLGKRMSVTPCTPNHFLAMSKYEIPDIPMIPDEVITAFVFGKSDRLAQPHEHQKWFASGNIPTQALHWVESNHLVVMDAPAEVARIIVQTVS